MSKTSVNVASFVGHSLVAIDTPDNAISRIEIELTFRSFSDQGLLLYAPRAASTDNNDFLSISIIDGYVEFRYDLGAGPLILRSSVQIKLGHWHHLVAKRYHQDGFLALDGSDKVTGKALGSLKTLNVGDLLWIGGIDKGKQY